MLQLVPGFDGPVSGEAGHPGFTAVPGAVCRHPRGRALLLPKAVPQVSAAFSNMFAVNEQKPQLSIYFDVLFVTMYQFTQSCKLAQEQKSLSCAGLQADSAYLHWCIVTRPQV